MLPSTIIHNFKNMKRSRFVISLTVAFIFFSFAHTASAAEEATGFSDLTAAHPNYNAIMDLQAKGVVSGYPDGTFMPDEVVNRAEALKIILRSSEIAGEPVTDTGDHVSFIDVTDGTVWYYPYLNAAVNAGIVEGYPDGYFRPANTLNLAENLKMLLLAKKADLSIINIIEDPYADVAKNAWFANYVQYAKEKNLIEANEDNNVFPSQGMTRGKLAEVMYRLIFMEMRNLNSFPQGTLINGAGQAINFDMTGLDVSIFRKTVPVTDVFSGNSLAAQARECASTYEAGHFTELASKLTGDLTTYTFIENRLAQDNEYVVSIMPNTPEYSDEETFKGDFNVCADGGTYPLKMSPDWLLFVGSCASASDGSNPLPMACAEMKTVIESTLTFR